MKMTLDIESTQKHLKQCIKSYVYDKFGMFIDENQIEKVNIRDGIFEVYVDEKNKIDPKYYESL